MKLYLKRSAALGNGTRPAGFCIGESSAKDVADLVLMDRNKVGRAFRLSPGVEASELVNFLANEDLISTEAPEVYSGPDSINVPLREASNPKKSDTPPAATWRDTPIAGVAGLANHEKILLAKANIKTLGELDDFGQKNTGLLALGITPEAEKAILDVVGPLCEE